eukprot:TRINITY_DN10859_c0_g1_i1.p1 TRINITY_DN10859_c0_g1~~TRINITY_DN10859_c0_g1_i1.p1  ORF type:complete len:416 (-),score=34.21 TRINITY_DN10859_c0_g1_i1:46-1293(-)
MGSGKRSWHGAHDGVRYSADVYSFKRRHQGTADSGKHWVDFDKESQGRSWSKRGCAGQDTWPTKRKHVERCNDHSFGSHFEREKKRESWSSEQASTSHVASNGEWWSSRRWSSGESWRQHNTWSWTDSSCQGWWQQQNSTTWGERVQWSSNGSGNDSKYWSEREESWRTWDWSNSWSSHEFGTDWVKDAAASLHTCTLIFLHSCHGRPEHVTNFVDDLKDRNAIDERRLRIVAPAAPIRTSESDQTGSLQWFEYRTEHLCSGADQDDVDKHQLLEQRERLLLLVRKELDRLPRDGRLIIGGLSQGGSMVADLLLHLQEPLDPRLKGAFFQRGFVQSESVEDLPPAKPILAIKHLPILATHGVDDDYVPFVAAKNSYGLVWDRGGSLTFKAIPGLLHNGYSDVESELLSTFIAGVL